MIAQSIMPVVAAAAAEVVVAMIWYSDNAFGPMWKKLGGKPASAKDLYSNVAMHAAVSLITASALLIAINVFQKVQTGTYTQEGLGFIFRMFLQDKATNLTAMSAMKTAGFLWLGFLAPSKAVCTIWSGSNWVRFAIESFGQLAGLAAMAAVIASVA